MGRTVKNTITGNIIQIPNPIDEEVVFEGSVMITETDTKGIITYANRAFREMTGYTKEELIGSPHNINRHPDMPKVAFKELWDTIKEGHYWEGYVKNLRSDGKYYLVLVFIKPKKDAKGNIIGYIAGRKLPEATMVDKVFTHYKFLLEEEKKA